MSPAEAKRLVGHSSPQPEAGSSAAVAAPFEPAAEDMVGRLYFEAANSDHCKAARLLFLDAGNEVTDLRRRIDFWTNDAVEKLANLASENDRLRTALRAVRASTDPQWQALLIAEALRETE